MSSVGRVIAVIDLLARRGAMGARPIAQALDIPNGSLHRLLHDLRAERVIEQTPSGTWQMSYRLLEIIDLQFDSVEVPRLVRPWLVKLARLSNETVNVNVLSGDECVCIDKVRGNEAMQLDWRIGTRGPLHCGGSAKAMLAYLPPEDQSRVLDGPLKRYNSHTLTDPGDVRAEIGRIRKRGYSIDAQEIVVGVYCVGVPILDRHGRPVAALSVSGPSVKEPGPALAPVVALLAEACHTVSRRLGYAGPPLPSLDAATRLVST